MSPTTRGSLIMSLSRDFSAVIGGAITGMAVAMLTACAPIPQQATVPHPQEAEAETAAPTALEPEDTMKALAPTDVRRMTCATLLGTADDDKAYASTFLLGYRSALMHTHTIDIKKIEAVEEAALAQCATTPNAIASKVFAVTFIRIDRAEKADKLGEPSMEFRHRRTLPNPEQPAAASQEQPAPASQERATPEPAPDQSSK
jgi:hypothetical protein